MSQDSRDLRTQLIEAFDAVESLIAWYFDRRKKQVVTVKGARVSDETLTAKEVDEDEERFLEIPPILESEVHVWMEDFVEERGDPKVSKLLDDRAGANARFLAKLEAKDPALLAAWKAYRLTRVAGAVDAWLTEIGEAPKR